MAVRKKEHGSLTGSKRYASEKGKTIEEQTQENHAKAVEKVKARFQSLSMLLTLLLTECEQ
jgi:hypothetical protein